MVTLCEMCHDLEHTQIIDPVRKYEHFIIRQQEPEVINTMKIQLHELHEKLKEHISDELTNEILGNIMYLKNKIKELMQYAK